MATFSVYKITNKINGKMYIGCTSKSLEIRFTQHIRLSQGNAKRYQNTVLYIAMRKYGTENFTISLLKETSNEEEMYQLEEQYIKELGTHYKNSGGYNMTVGGDGVRGYQLNEENLRKLSESHLKYYQEHPEAREEARKRGFSPQAKEANRKVMIGRVHSQEEKDKRSKSMTGKSIPKLYREFTLFSPNNEIITSQGITPFCKEHNLSTGCIGAVLQGRQNFHRGWILYNPKYSITEHISLREKFIQQTVANRNAALEKGRKPTVFELISPEGLKIKVQSMNQFCKNNHFSRDAIKRLLRKEIDEHKGWKLPN